MIKNMSCTKYLTVARWTVYLNPNNIHSNHRFSRFPFYMYLTELCVEKYNIEKVHTWIFYFQPTWSFNLPVN